LVICGTIEHASYKEVAMADMSASHPYEASEANRRSCKWCGQPRTGHDIPTVEERQAFYEDASRQIDTITETPVLWDASWVVMAGLLISAIAIGILIGVWAA
jgi:hypothetical protein